jgi:hypothetical protein
MGTLTVEEKYAPIGKNTKSKGPIRAISLNTLNNREKKRKKKGLKSNKPHKNEFQKRIINTIKTQYPQQNKLFFHWT